MSKPLCVCTICSEDFTRKSDGDRHNQRFHSGKGQIIGFIEYIIGRTQNAIPPPTEPTPRLAAARRRKKAFFYNKNDRGYTVYPDTKTGPSILNNECNLHHSSVPSTEKMDSSTNFSSSQKTQDKSFLDESIDYARKLTELQRLLRDMSSHSSTYPDFFIPSSVSIWQPNRYLIPETGMSSYTFDIDKHMPNRKYIFGFSGQSCNQCLSFEIVPHYFAAPNRDMFTRTTHKCKESLAKFSIGIQQDIDIHSLVRNNCAHMLHSIYVLTNIWTDNKPYLRIIPLYNQLREKHEILQVRYPPNPDKLIRVPLKPMKS